MRVVGLVELKKKGDIVEGYRVLDEIGQGAASVIYLVQDPRTKQIWALKHVEKQDAKDQRFLDQAEQEYEVSRHLDHPGIRKIDRLIRKKRQFISVKELYLVMEYVDGQPLHLHPPKTQVEAVEIFSQIAAALGHMHGRGFVHADMKPNNVIWTGEHEAKIIDLGQSCKIGTVKPRIQGTPDYIAPEQVHRRAITPKTDIFNLGATMYWVLTGKTIPTALPKDDQKLVGSLDDHMIERARPVIELTPHVNQRLSDLVMQCIEVDPSKRPESMAVVADRLNLILGILRAEAERKAGGEARAGADAPPAA
jgi:serine/threonine-protein kinase